MLFSTFSCFLFDRKRDGTSSDYRLHYGCGKLNGEAGIRVQLVLPPCDMATRLET